MENSYSEKSMCRRFITASIGILPANVGHQSAQELLRDADISMYKAKANDKNCYEVFVPAMRQGILRRLNLETDLRRAIDHQEMSLRYQPIINLKHRSIVGFEALLRWENPDHAIARSSHQPGRLWHGLLIPQLSAPNAGGRFKNRRVVYQLPPDHTCRQDIIKTILALGNNLGRQIVAEGIETEPQRKQLVRLGCELGQGYLFAKPLLPDAIDLLL
ncbi:hypothetical protein C7271_19320 [filamentous cyanobacterium CCP5]|nr:hypothetical protein C7271_19320 [filamentous cyanobacterium CCP5]